MADLGDIGTEMLSSTLDFAMNVVGPQWPDISIAMPPDSGGGSGSNPETFSAYIAG